MAPSVLCPGDRLGRFRILAPLGAGGMGEVYRARDERLERDIAVKVLPRETFDGEAARLRFHREAQALARLSHPHIGQLYDFASEAGVDFLVMELVAGDPVSKRLEAGPLSETEVLELGRQLASALEAAHAAGVVHRDLKPANLMFTDRGELKVLDFGLARLSQLQKAHDATMTLAERDSVSGTLPYMAPEQLLGGEGDPRTDLWAAGVVLYELITGKRPFEDKLTTRLTNAILHSAPEPPARPGLGVSPGLGRIILKCLEKKPEDRYASARDLGADLEKLAATGTVKIAFSGQVASRRRGMAVAGAALAILAAAILLWHPWRTGPAVAAPAAPIKSLAVLPLDNFTGDPGQEYFSDGMTEALIAELSKIRSLRVISRKSVLPFKKSALSLPEIGRKLGVEGVVEGSVRRGAGRVSVTAELIRAASDEHLWTESFERQETDVLSLHGDIARAIARQVQAVISPDEARSLEARHKVDPEAYDLALRADYLVANAAGPDDVIRGLDLAQKAVAADPDSAVTQASLSNALQFLPNFGVKTGREILPLARAAAEKALRLDPELPSAQLARIGVLEYGYEFEEAFRELKRIIALRPNDGLAHGMLGYLSAILGRFQDMETELRRSIGLDPLNMALRCNLMNVLYALRRDDEAVATANEILALTPKWFWANDNLSSLAFLRGRKDEAFAQSVKGWQIPWADFKPPEGAGWDAYARWLPEELKRRDGKPFHLAGFIAAAYAVAGENEKAIPYLEREVEEAGIWTIEMFWPEFDGLRADPRFLTLINKMNLPVDVYKMPFREAAAAAARKVK